MAANRLIERRLIAMNIHVILKFKIDMRRYAAGGKCRIASKQIAPLNIRQRIPTGLFRICRQCLSILLTQKVRIRIQILFKIEVIAWESLHHDVFADRRFPVFNLSDPVRRVLLSIRRHDIRRKQLPLMGKPIGPQRIQIRL